MQISIRKFIKTDIPNKIKWVNDPKNNAYLHYDIPLKFDKTEKWFDSIENRTDRFDAVILCNGKSVGLIGLLDITDCEAEYYVMLGEYEYRGKGIAKEASLQLLRYAKDDLGLKTINLYTEVDNIEAQMMFEKIGFDKQCVIKSSAVNRGKRVDCFYYTFDLRGLNYV